MPARREFVQGLLCAAVAASRPAAWAMAQGGAGAARPKGEPRFSVMLWTLAKQAGLDGRLEEVAAAGYHGVELVGEFQEWSPVETDRVLGRLEALHLQVDAMSGVATGFAVPGAQERFLAELRAQMVWARRLGCARIILLSGKLADAGSAAKQRQVATENLARAADLLAAEQMEAVIEPIDRLEDPQVYLSGVTEAFALARAVKRANLGVLYDLYHEQRGYGNLIEKLRPNVDLLRLVHVADVPGRHEPGTGEIDYPNVFRALGACGYVGTVAMEFYPTGDPVDTLRRAREAAAKAMDEGRRGQAGSQP